MQDGAKQREWLDRTVEVIPREYVLEVQDVDSNQPDPPPRGGGGGYQLRPRPPPPPDTAQFTANLRSYHHGRATS